MDSARWFEDCESRDQYNRAAFKDLQSAIFNGEIKTVVVWKLDRLAGSMRTGINIIKDWCEKDIRIVSVTQEIDLFGTVGHIIAAVLLGVSEIELNNIRERQAAGSPCQEAGEIQGEEERHDQTTPQAC